MIVHSDKSLYERCEKSRGSLTESQLTTLDELLAHHNLPESSPYETPERLAFVCLSCGSIGEGASREHRDEVVLNSDLTCCGLTVIFHSSHRVLVNPANLTIVRQES